MYIYDQISHLHVEATTRCNAACPMCARNSCGGIAPGLPLTELRIKDFRSLFPSEFLAHVQVVDICGAYGDPILAQDLLAIVEYLCFSNTGCCVNIFTNGGLRHPSWWRSLALAMGSHGTVVFAIDGLESTNNIYRRGVNFRRVIENAQAFISAGGIADWDYLVFRHNEHQVEEARVLSERLGFRRFAVKKTSRFLKWAYEYVPELVDQEDPRSFPIYDHRGNRVGQLETPYELSMVNETVKSYDCVRNIPEALNEIFSKTLICCHAAKNRSVFVSATGHAFPCCWTYAQATAPVLHQFATGVDTQMYHLVQACGGFDRVDALARGLAYAVGSPLFEAIERSWKQSSIASGRQKVCARVCGTEFTAFLDQFEGDELVPGNAGAA